MRTAPFMMMGPASYLGHLAIRSFVRMGGVEGYRKFWYFPSVSGGQTSLTAEQSSSREGKQNLSEKQQSIQVKKTIIKKNTHTH